MLKLFKEREGERQEFVEDLMRLVTKQAEASDGLLISNLSIEILRYLKERSGLREKVGLWEKPAENFFNKAILSRLDDFTSSTLEKDYLLCGLLKKLISSLAYDYEAKFFGQEFSGQVADLNRANLVRV